MSNLIGQKLGKYQIIERVARGGMADVYKAKAVSLDRYVAVKVMHDHLTQSPEYTARFKREADSIARLRHPHIVQLYDFDVEGDIHYMVMEFINGGTVEQYLRNKGRLTPLQTLNVAIPLASALAYAHQSGIIHRDIKPSNIMFADTAFEHPILTDFGITMVQNSSALTREGLIIGTPGYISPEAGLHQKLDKGADIYSMGVLLYELLTGKLPFSGDNPFVMFLSQMNDPLPDPAQLVPNLPASLVAVIHCCLAPQPQDRYQTAQELKEALEQVKLELDESAPRLFETKTPIKGLATIAFDKPDMDQPKSRSLTTKIAVFAAILIAIIGGVVIINNRNNSGDAEFAALAFEATATVEPTEATEIAPTATVSLPTETPQPTVEVQATVQLATEVLLIAPSATNLPPTRIIEPIATNTVTPQPTNTSTATLPPTASPTPAPTNMEIGKAVTALLPVGETKHIYEFAASPTNAIFLTLTTPDTAAGLLLEVEDQNTGELVVVLRPRVTASCIRIIPNDHTYVLTIGSENVSSERSYTLKLTAATSQQRDCPVS